ncbi:MAG: type II secretion system F family protein [Proteobacteria bacterium]|nr:type II secretion system F family protein [Pseudomonadota bacterium]
MAIYSYQASTRDGNMVEGVIEAADDKAVIERLKDAGAIPIKVTAQKENIRTKIHLRSSRKDLQAFTTELSVLLNAGLTLDRSLQIVSDVSGSDEIKGVVQSLLKSIREGNTFSDALQKYPKIFPRMYVNMIRAGEASGVLNVILEKLNEYLESSRELREHIISAMIYPAILIITGGISIIILLTFVLPKFSVIFAELGGALPLPTQILLSLSEGLRAFWWIMLLTIAAGWVAFRYYLKSDGGRYRWDAFKIRIMGELIGKLETVRFCRTLGLLLKSGVPLLQALNNARDVIGNQVIASALGAVSKGAKEGKGISAPLTEAGVLPALAMSMIKVGEETGQLDTMLLKVAAAYEKSLQETIKRFVSLLEPAMILIMGLIIGFIVISMLVAIFSITDLPV